MAKKQVKETELFESTNSDMREAGVKEATPIVEEEKE